MADREGERETMEREKIRRWLVPAVMILSVVLMGWYLCQLQGQDRVSDAKLEDVTAAVTKTLDTKAMQESDSQMIKRLYGLNPADYAGIALYYPATNMDAEELLIVQLKDVSRRRPSRRLSSPGWRPRRTALKGTGWSSSPCWKRASWTWRGTTSSLWSTSRRRRPRAPSCRRCKEGERWYSAV